MTALIFDTESTGLDSPRIIEAAWLKIPDPNDLPTERFCQRYRPERELAVEIIGDDDCECPICTIRRAQEGIRQPTTTTH